jgi:hypothetical protein
LKLIGLIAIIPFLAELSAQPIAKEATLMHRRRFVFAFVLTNLLFGTINVAMANIGPIYDISAGTSTGTGTGAAPTFTVPVSGTLVIPAGSTINQSSLKATSGSRTFTGNVTFTLTTAGVPGAGNDVYSVGGSITVPAGTYTLMGTIIYTPPGSVVAQMLQSSGVVFTVP